MKPLKVLVSLIIENSDYQKEQVATTMAAARGKDLSIEIIYAENDAVNQSQQLARAIQDREHGPDVILVEPVGTGMAQLARAAAVAGIGWGVVNREVDYMDDLRRSARAPMFAVSTDNEEVGRIQGRQFSALSDGTGTVLYLEGPGTSGAAQQRTRGMMSTKPPDMTIKALKGDWSDGSAYRAVKSWLSLSTSRQLHIKIVGCQNDAMAAGARRAFEEVSDNTERTEWLNLPITGCDGVRATGQQQVRQGALAATIVTPPTMGLAMQLLIDALSSKTQPPELTRSEPTSYPSIEELAQRFRQSSRV